jgi:hypothetical protein
MKRKLEIENEHRRDARIQFDEASHTYTVDGKKFKGSVSSFWGEFFDHFNPKPVIRRCFSKWKNTNDEKFGYALLYMIVMDGIVSDDDLKELSKSAFELRDFTQVSKKLSLDEGCTLVEASAGSLNDKGYYWLIRYLMGTKGMSEDDCKLQIEKFWGKLGERASTDGTYMHLQLELKNNGETYDTSMYEVKLYEKFVEDHPWLVPYRTEWSVFSTDVHLAGQIDLVVRDTRFTPNRFYIIDFKRCKDRLGHANPYHKFGKPPFHRVPDTPCGHYSVQQAAYRWFLETLYGITISKCYLLQLHPTMDEYNLVRLPDLRQEMSLAIASRRSK